MEGELLQVHQRDAQRHGGLEPPRRAAVPRRGERHRRRRRLRARPRLRRDPDDRRPLLDGEPARGAAARRAAGDRRADPPHRQAEGPPRPRRRLLHHQRRRARGSRADQWKLVDRIAKPQAFAQAVQERAAALAATSDRPGAGAGHRAHAACSGRSTRRAITTSTSMCDRPPGARPRRSPCAAPTAAAAGRSGRDPPRRRELVAARDGARARRRDPAACAPTSSTSAPGSSRRAATLDAVLAVDAALDAQRDHWFVRETIGLLRRTLARLDVSSRTLFAIVDEGSCFAGTLAELALAADRTYMLALPDDERGGAADRAVGDELRRLPHGERPLAARQRASAARPRRSTRRRRALGREARRRRGARARARHVRARRPRLGRRGAHRDRGAREPLARRAHRHGSEPALRRPGNDGDPDLRPPLRMAELDLQPAERRRRAGRAEGVRHRAARRNSTGKESRDRRSHDDRINYSERIPNNVNLATDRTLQRALEHWQPRFLDWWQRDGAARLRRANDVYLRTARRRRRAKAGRATAT